MQLHLNQHDIILTEAFMYVSKPGQTDRHLRTIQNLSIESGQTDMLTIGSYRGQIITLLHIF